MADTLTDHQVYEVEKAFTVFDLNKDGRITSDELHKVFNSLGFELGMDELKSFMDRVDTDGNGTLDFEEFCHVLASHVQETTAVIEDIKQAFTEWDTDGDGKISASELKETLRKVGEELSDDQIIQMIRTVDRDGDGHISLEEFLTMMYVFQINV